MSKKIQKKATVEAPKPKEFENTTERDIFTSKGRVRPGQCVTLFESEKKAEGLKSV